VWEPQVRRTQLGPPGSERRDVRHLEEASHLEASRLLEANRFDRHYLHVERHLEVASQPVQLPGVNCLRCCRHRCAYCYQQMVEVNLGGLKERQPEHQPELGVPVCLGLQAPHLFSLS
jgi:hypothetical protein